jgi:NAD(P)-dependent dehydrogenase (short-subunit alcohol dehydrogenase family)
MTGGPDSTAVPDYGQLLRQDGRGYVVLGGGQGIGRQACHALVQLGANVVVADVDQARVDQVVGELTGHAVGWVGDITGRTEMQRLVRDSRAGLGGRVHGFVDIVGMAQYGRVVDTTDEQWDWHHDIVLRHAWLAIQHFGAAMATDGGGSMVFVASVSGIGGAPMHAAYGAFKAGLINLVRSVAVELGPAGIRVNAVAPGLVWTPRLSAALGDDGLAFITANSPLGRVALPADIAAALLYLSCDLAAYVNGQTLIVDGGVSGTFAYQIPGADDQ